MAVSFGVLALVGWSCAGLLQIPNITKSVQNIPEDSKKLHETECHGWLIKVKRNRLPICIQLISAGELFFCVFYKYLRNTCFLSPSSEEKGLAGELEYWMSSPCQLTDPTDGYRPCVLKLNSIFSTNSRVKSASPDYIRIYLPLNFAEFYSDASELSVSRCNSTDCVTCGDKVLIKLYIGEEVFWNCQKTPAAPYFAIEASHADNVNFCDLRNYGTFNTTVEWHP